MGCDCHAHIEIKINDKWENYTTCWPRRNYSLFAKMAGVRNYDNEIIPIANPRGLPPDISIVTKFDSDHWGEDGHSHSYLTAEELVELEQFYTDLMKQRNAQESRWIENEFGYVFGNSLAGFIKWPEDRPSGLQDVRLVFWFDN